MAQTRLDVFYIWDQGYSICFRWMAARDQAGERRQRKQLEIAVSDVNASQNTELIKACSISLTISCENRLGTQKYAKICYKQSPGKRHIAHHRAGPYWLCFY